MWQWEGGVGYIPLHPCFTATAVNDLMVFNHGQCRKSQHFGQSKNGRRNISNLPTLTRVPGQSVHCPGSSGQS